MKKLLVIEIAIIILFLLGMIFAYYMGLVPRAERTMLVSDARGERTLVIDAGHGGLDGGAVAADGTCESGINLDVALRLDNVMGLYGARTILTRSSDDIDYPDSAVSIRDKKVADLQRRLSLVNSAENAVFISIHQNSYPDDTGVRGVQILYSGTDGSRELAESIHSDFISVLGGASVRESIPTYNDIFIMKKVKCPAVLIECGFLSNQDELKRLKDGRYRLDLAEVIAAGYLSSAERPVL
ncbi:MAG: N-acetylmuramoyl-L-alanine amidase [Oscillospiraceae bacterium]|nr:N-acetylmuramoyl-L-alanine amidase [Oscillospiraceae bacterium]